MGVKKYFKKKTSKTRSNYLFANLRLFLSKVSIIVAFDKERFPNAVEIEIFGPCIHGHQSPPPEKLFRANDLSIDYVRELESRFNFCLVSRLGVERRCKYCVLYLSGEGENSNQSH